MRVKNAGVCGDGGTHFIELEFDDGRPTQLIGLDARIPTPPHQRRIFLDAEHPTNPNARILPIGSPDEASVIELLTQWADQNLSFLRREALMTPGISHQLEADFGDQMGLSILLGALDRSPPAEKKRVLP
ncbi:hypothetical protein [Prosthecobacter sp.]|jgi:hypothetical protein|uniref:hypothetical protein n=1 Tax=Prosthecobacter sp. TaxID=1965333 RepID=UPI0037C9849F